MSDTSFDELVDRGVAAHQQNRFDEALQAYQAALALHPENAEITSLKGLALTHLGRLDEALPILEKAVEQEPDNAGLRLNLVECLERAEQIERATKQVETILSTDANRPRAWEKKGDLAARLGALDTAAHAYATASGLNRENPLLAIKLARAHAALQQFAEAHHALDRADALQPNNPAVFELRAAILLDQLDWPALEAIARLWINAMPGNSAAWHRLTQATFEQGLYRQAIAAYRKVLELTERSATNLTAYARICLHALEYELASEALDEAEAANPNLVEMLAARGLLLAYRGEFDAALSYCRRCLDLDPAYAPAYTQLTRLTRGKLDAADRANAERLANDTSKPIENRILAQFAVGHGLDADGDVDAAFAAYSRANALQLEQNRAENLAYVPQATESRTAELLAAFGEARDCDLPPGPARPVFIVGLPRSGTTLVESVLAAHSSVTAGGERPLMMRLLDAWLRLQRSGGAGREQLEELARIYLDEGPAKDGIVTDKNPLNFEAVGLIMRLFPDAVVIHMRRDPLETGLSIYRHEFAKFWRFAHRLEDIGHFHGHYDRLVRHWERLYPGRFITVNYEEFASNFVPAARALFERCGIPWEADCERFQQSAPAIATFSAVQAREPVVVRTGKAEAYAAHLVPLRDALAAVAE